MESNRNNIAPFTALIAVCLFIYAVLRAIYVPITIDEVTSILHFSTKSAWDILSYAETSSNNHILNTLLIKLCAGLFNGSELVHRLPNLAAHALYLLFSLLFTRRIQNPFIALCGFCLLNLQPYLFDYFSLARGYGLAAGFFMGAVYFLLRYREARLPRYATLCLLFASLGALSGISTIVFLVALCAALLFCFYRHQRHAEKQARRKAFLLHFRFGALVLLILTAIMFEPVRKLRAFGGLEYGGEKGFWQDTVMSLISTFSYEAPYQHLLIPAVNGLVAIALLCGLILFVTRVLKRKLPALDSDAFLALFVAMLAAAIIITEFRLLGVRLLIGRTSLHFVVLFAVFLTCLLSELGSVSRSAGRITTAVSLLLVLSLSAHFVAAANLRYTYEWKFDSATPQVLADIRDEALRSGQAQKVSIACTWPSMAAMNYYRIVHRQDWMLPVETDTLKKNFDYYYIIRGVSTVNPDTMILVKEYALSSGCVARPHGLMKR